MSVLANTLSPSRCPPYMSLVGAVSGRYASPCSSSALISDHRLASPLYDHESFSHVSLPTSPGWGIGLNVHGGLPERTSKACAAPGGASLRVGGAGLDPPILPLTMHTSRRP